MSEKTPKLPKSVTPEELKKLVAKHGKGKVVPLQAESDGKTYVALVKKPSLMIIDAGTSESRTADGGVDPMKLIDFVWKNCKLAVDPEIEADDELLAGARTACFSLFKTVRFQVGEAFA